MRDDTKPSRTALIVLGGTALTASDPRWRETVDPEVALWAFMALKALGSPVAWLVKLAPVRWLCYRFERRMVPGISRHFAARKGAIAGLVMEAAPKRLFVLGAGLDGLAYRFAKTIKAHEGDLPGSQELKRRLLSRLEARPVELHAVDAGAPDFRFPAGILGPETLVVAEGLTMYLPEARDRAILAQVAKSESRIVFTFMSLDSAGRPAFGRGQNEVDGLLKRVGEPFQWGIAPEDLPDYLERIGLRLEKLLGAEDVSGMVPGEWIAYAVPAIRKAR